MLHSVCLLSEKKRSATLVLIHDCLKKPTRNRVKVETFHQRLPMATKKNLLLRETIIELSNKPSELLPADTLLTVGNAKNINDDKKTKDLSLY